jgi:hypothetical protein
MDQFDFTVAGPGDLRPGDIGFYTIAGRVGGAVSVGQALLRDACRFTHAFMVIAKEYPRIEEPMRCVEAMPAGARRAPLDGRFGPGYGYVRLPLSPEQRDAITPVTLETVGRPYSFMDYLALAAWEWNVPGRTLVRRYVTSSQRMICSQLVDFVLCEVGFHLFTDGRLPQDVTPGQLWWQAGAVGRAFWWPEHGPARSVPLPEEVL